MTDMKNWEKKKLGEVCVVERGSSPRPIEKYQTDSPDGVNWIKIGDTKGVDKYIFSTKEKITKEGAEKSRYVKEGDFILSNSMSFGKPYIMKTDGYIHDGWFVFRLPNFLDKDYFYYLLTSPNVQEQIQSLGAGAIVKNISGDLVKKVDITYPKSLPEQQRIVAILDEAFAAIAKAKANAEQNLKNAKELFESYLQAVFENKGQDWEEKTLGEVCNVIGGGTPSKANGKFYDGDINWATVRDMKGEIISDTEYKITKDAVKNSSTNIIPKGNVIIATRVGLGKVCLIEFDTAINQDLRGIVPLNLKKLSVDFLYRWFKSISHKIVEEGTGATVQGVKLPFIKSLKISLPPLIAQQDIVQKLDALSTETKKLEAIYQQKINDLEELKKSILQKAFAGELTSAGSVSDRKG
jgi:type I restriction enzyme S subunit